MAAGAPRVFVSHLAGVAVFDPNGDQVGRVRDLVAMLRVGGKPPGCSAWSSRSSPAPDLPAHDPGDRHRVGPGHHHRRGQHAALRAAAHRAPGPRRAAGPAGAPHRDRRGGHRPRLSRAAAARPPRLGDRQVLRTQGQDGRRPPAGQGRDADRGVVGGQRLLRWRSTGRAPRACSPPSSSCAPPTSPTSCTTCPPSAAPRSPPPWTTTGSRTCWRSSPRTTRWRSSASSRRSAPRTSWRRWTPTTRPTCSRSCRRRTRSGC